ncbi:hypothetical protein JOS77_18190 [Chromobacterium haemolyticum]|nr:hypothetical protein JOS77_18190 [Chromobacterium haemolyticum]
MASTLSPRSGAREGGRRRRFGQTQLAYAARAAGDLPQQPRQRFQQRRDAFRFDAAGVEYAVQLNGVVVWLDVEG